MCRRKVLTRQPEISQPEKERPEGVEKGRIASSNGTEATVECDPSGLDSVARNDVSCYATILQRAPLIAQPVPGTIKSFAALSAKNYHGSGERKRENECEREKERFFSNFHLAKVSSTRTVTLYLRSRVLFVSRNYEPFISVFGKKNRNL